MFLRHAAKEEFQQQRNKQANAFRDVLAEFQQDLRHVLQNSVETALCAVL